MIDAARLIAGLHEITHTPQFADLLTSLHAAKYTGPVTIHFIHGVPTAAELPREPVKVALHRSRLTPAPNLAHTLR